MEAIIKNKGNESTMTIRSDFNQILNDNFAAVCQAIANKGLILNELKEFFDKEKKAVDDIVQIIHKSVTPELAVVNLHEEKGISMMAAQYIMNLPLARLTSMDCRGIRQELAKYKKQIGIIMQYR